MDDTKPVRLCSICGVEYRGHGNNADPINDGRCCDKCDHTVVIPTRIAMIYRARKPKED